MIGSNEGQDDFAMRCFPGVGMFLDFGCADVREGSNSFRLEQNGWRGVLFDRKPIFSVERESEIIVCDLTRPVPYLLIHTISSVDYVSVDVDEATPDFIKGFPFELIQFGCMTFEHDGHPDRKREMIARLKPFPEYQIVGEDICHDGGEGLTVFEDWWVNTRLLPDVMRFARKGVLWRDFLETFKP